MSPILVRPIREQLEHDRVIRLLKAKYKKKFDVGINPAAEQAAPVGSGTSAIFPDLVLQSGRKLMAVVEVETSESVNHLEAMSQWASLGRLRALFYLYVPANSLDTTRRLCADHQVAVSEIWTYTFIGDQPRFTQITRSSSVPQVKAPAARPSAGAARRAVPPAKKKASPARRTPAAAKAAPRKRPVAAKAKKAAKPSRAARSPKRK